MGPIYSASGPDEGAAAEVTDTGAECESEPTANVPALPDEELANFERGQANLKTYVEGDKLYRVSSPSNEDKHYWTPQKPASEIQWRIDSAVRPEWGNNAKRLSTLEVPPGQTLSGWAGKAAYQGDWYVGGADQVYLADPPADWITTEGWNTK